MLPKEAVQDCHPSTRRLAVLPGNMAKTPPLAERPMRPQVARRRTSHTVTAISSAESTSSQPPSIHWNAQNRLAGW